MSPSWEFLLDTLWRWHLCQGFRAKQFFLLCLLFPRGIGEESQEGPDTPRGEPPPQGAGHRGEGAFASLETNSAPGSSEVQTLRKLCQPAHSCCSLSVTSQVPSKGPAPRPGPGTGEEASAVPPGGICGPDGFSPSPQRDCQNYIKILLPLNSSHLLTCGTAAFSPLCAYIVSSLCHPGAWLQLPGYNFSLQGGAGGRGALL